MRVLYVGRGFGVHDRRFVTAFAAQPPIGPGWDVGAVALNGSALDGLPPGAVAVLSGITPTKGAPSAAATQAAVDRVREAAHEFGPDVVVAGPLQGATLPAVQAVVAPVMAVSWAFDLLADAVGGGRRAAREALAGSAALLCDARVVAQLAQEMGMPAARITIAPWGVDLERFRPGGEQSVRAALGWAGNFVVLSARNHEPLYRLDTVMRGFASAVAAVPSLRLAVVGDGSLRAAIQAQARVLGIAGLVHFVGRVEPSALAAWYSSADVYVSASQVDGSSVSLMEAMASGLPAVVSDIPGNAEWVEPGATGWLFPLGDPAQLAGALVEVARMPVGERARLGGAARAVAEARANWALNSRRITDAVAALVSARR